MDLHVLHDEDALKVTDERPGRPRDLSDLLGDLSFVREQTSTVPGRLVLPVHPTGRATLPPPGEHAASHPDTVRVEHSGDDAYVTDGASLLHVEAHETKHRDELRQMLAAGRDLRRRETRPRA